MRETQQVRRDEDANGKHDQRVQALTDLNNVFLLSHAVRDHAAEQRCRHTRCAVGQRHDAEGSKRARQLEDEPAADEHLHVHRREAPKLRSEEPAKIPIL